MNRPIKPMSAEEIVKELNHTKFGKYASSCFECCDYEEMDEDLKAFIRHALASHLAYVKEKLEPYEKTMTKGYGGITITETHKNVSLCLAVLQSEIDELTK